MKKVLIGFFTILILGQVANAQPVSDNAVIPMAITVQSIMRLNIKSGGNMEFVFNKISDLTTGIPNSAAYDTRFDISASQNWDLNIGTDNANFIGEVATNFFAIDVVNLFVEDDGSTRLGAGEVATTFAVPTVLPNVSTALLTNATTDAGTSAQNGFVIHWACGTAPSPTMLSTGAPADRYTVNVYLNLVAAP
jgi:hypothetical protein